MFSGDSLLNHKDSPFSTKDADHDSWGGSCSTHYHGAWWYHSCRESNLNGLYSGVLRGSWLRWDESLKAVTMKMRSATFPGQPYHVFILNSIKVIVCILLNALIYILRWQTYTILVTLVVCWLIVIISDRALETYCLSYLSCHGSTSIIFTHSGILCTYFVIPFCIFCFHQGKCDSNPCGNGGSCCNEVNKFSCTCAAGFEGATCQTGRSLSLQ